MDIGYSSDTGDLACMAASSAPTGSSPGPDPLETGVPAVRVAIPGMDAYCFD